MNILRRIFSRKPHDNCVVCGTYPDNEFRVDDTQYRELLNDLFTRKD